ncbi:transmembrane protein 69-like [Argonauta hians]
MTSSSCRMWKLLVPLLNNYNSRSYHCLASIGPLSTTVQSSVHQALFGRIKTTKLHPLSMVSCGNYKESSTSPYSRSLVKSSSATSTQNYLPCYIPPHHLTRSLAAAKSVQCCRHASSGSSAGGDRFRIQMAKSLMGELKDAPMPPMILGASGLLPFVSFPFVMYCSGVYLPDLALLQVTYGAVILSFLGGVRWGTTCCLNNVVKPDISNLVPSILPSLGAWIAIQLPSPLACLALVGGFTSLAYYDMTFPAYYPWFKALRVVLSGVAVVALMFNLLFYVALARQKNCTPCVAATPIESSPATPTCPAKPVNSAESCPKATTAVQTPPPPASPPKRACPSHNSPKT